MNKITTAEGRSLRDNFRYWGVHISLCSFPSFFLAFTTNYNATHCVAAMIIGIAMFVVFYSFLTSSAMFRSVTRDPTLHQAIRWGTNLRTSISVVGAFGWVLGAMFRSANEAALVFFAPDLYAGMFAIKIVNSVGRSWPLESLRVSVLGDDPGGRATNIWLGDLNSFLPTLATVLIEGVIISISLVTICFVLAFALKVFEKRRA